MRSVFDICPNMAWEANSPSRAQKRSNKPRSSSKSDEKSTGEAPPCRWSISGRVLKPCGQEIGTQSARGFRIVRLKRLVDGLMYFSFSAARRESLKWQII